MKLSDLLQLLIKFYLNCQYSLVVYDNKAKHHIGEGDGGEKNLGQKSRMDPMSKVEQHFEVKRREHKQHKKHKKQKKEHKKEVY